MKKSITKISKYASMLLAVCLLGTSCQKIEVPTPTIPSTILAPTDIASTIVGTYVGTGDNPKSFLLKTIEIKKVSNTRVRIEPLSAPLNAFEVEIEEIFDIVKATDDEEAAGIDFEVIKMTKPYIINIDCLKPNQNFAGQKQP